MNIFRRFGRGVAASDPPEVPPTPDPTPEEKAEMYRRRLHEIDSELELAGDRIKEFRKFHVVCVPTRGRKGGVILTERFLADEVTARSELAQVWDSLWHEVSTLMKERNRILQVGAEVWAKK